MNTQEYFKSLSDEFASVKDRIRNFIGTRHWASDGQWKESVVKSVLRRYLPSQYIVGTGFVISDDDVSTQIDILVCDSTGPVLFRDGDFMVVTPDIVAAVIEVKTRVQTHDIEGILMKLNNIGEILCKQPRGHKPFIGLFSFEDEAIDLNRVLAHLKEVNGAFGSYEVQCIALGPSNFVRFWRSPPIGPDRDYSKWHAYKLGGTAPGYFIHNVIEHLFPHAVISNQGIWYPREGKEPNKVGEIGKRGINE